MLMELEENMDFGLLIDRTNEDKEILFNNIMSDTTELPDKVSLKEYCSPVQSQGKRGFCWAFTAAEFKAIQECKEEGRRFQMSPLYCAKKGKEIDGLDEDGATSKTLFKTITDYGAIEERYYPYSLVDGMNGTLKFPEVPKIDKNVTHYKCQVPVKLKTPTEIDRALANGNPVALGIVCMNSIYDLNNNKYDVIPMPVGSYPVGCHEIVIVGYDNKMTRRDRYDKQIHTGYYLIKNSWGGKWGDKGYAWMPKDYLTHSVEITSTQKMTFIVDAYTALDIKNIPANDNVITMYIGSKDVKVNGKNLQWDVAPQIQKDRTLVPLRNISELLGYKVQWNEVERKIILSKNNVEIVMFIESNIVVVNGATQTWDVSPTIDKASSRTLVPLRNISELLGYYVMWKDDEKEITLIKAGN